MVRTADSPKVVVLENVLGLRQVLEEVKSELKSCGNYAIEVLELNPTPGGMNDVTETAHLRLDFGVNCTRNRLYILMLRRDYIKDLGSIPSTIDALKSAKPTPWSASQFVLSFTVDLGGTSC